MSTEIKVNKNQAVIDGLLEAAEYLQGHPDIPALTIAWLRASVWTKSQLHDAARVLGSCEKIADDHYYVLRRAFGPLHLEVSISRDQICKKIITWDCPEDPLLGIPESAE